MHTSPPNRREALRLLAGAACAAAGGSGAAEPKVYLEASRLKAAAEYAATHRGSALLIKQHGKVIHESYANGGRRGEPRRIYSGTKAFWCLAALVAVEDEIISLDETVADTIHEWKDLRGKNKITVRQLLLFTSGLERGLKIHNDGLDDRNAIALARPMVATPGKAFIYGPSSLQVLHELLKRKLAGRKRAESPTRYLERRVLRPMDLGPQRYVADAKGNPLLAAGFMMTAGQWSRMGDLVLRSGAPVLKEESFENLTEGSSANAAYAFGFWNNKAAGNSRAREIDVENMLERDWNTQSWSRACLCREAPRDLMACIGSGYNRLFIVPSLKLIVVRQGQNANFSDGAFLRLLLGSA